MKNYFPKILTGLIVLALTGLILFVTLPLPGTIPVLMYHMVGTEQDALELGNFTSTKSLDRQMNFLKRFGYHVITLDRYDAIQTGQIKPRGREILLTFDDGDFSFGKSAIPVLEKYQFPVAMFLISDFIQTGNYGSMDLETVLSLQKKYPWVNFQSHAKTHPHLKEIRAEQIKVEMEDSKKDLERLLGKPVDYFAYPFGELDQRSLKAVQDAGYKMAFTTSYRRLGGIPETLYSRTRLKMEEHSGNPFIFWGYVSGIYQNFKKWREEIKSAAGKT